MNFAELFIRRPVATTLVMIGILGAGVIGYRQLPVSDLPTVEYPTINVRAALPGASPETMASAVAAPLENQFSSIPGVTTITSTSGQGGTSIALQFALGRDIDAAAQDVQAAIASVQRTLPKDMPAPPSYSKANPADQPIITIALTSPTLPLSTVDDYAETLLAKRLSAIEGVGQVNVVGGKKYAVRIQLDPRTLAYRRIAIEDVVAAISASNVNSPTGVLWGEHQALSLEATGQLTNAAAFKSIAVAYRNGAPVRLEDLGRVTDDVQDTKSISYYNGTPAITINVQRQPGSNTVQVADAVRAAVTQLQGELPPSIRMDILSDRSSTIRETVSDVKFTLVLALCLVVLVIFLFLRKIYATVIPSIALPMSIVGTFGVMALMGYSIDNLSMMALTLAVGFVVDDAIVMLENIVRHVEMGKKPMQAALEGSREVSFTIVSMTLSLAAVFIPVLFMGGLLGRLFREFAVTIGVAILVSGFVSLTLTPMMCSRFLKAHGAREQRPGRFFQATERAYQRMLDLYERSLHWVMHHRLATMVFSGVILVATIVLFVVTPKGFIPEQDVAQINGSLDLVQGASYDEVLNHLLISQKILMERNDPDILAISTSTGGGGVGHGANHYHANLYLTPRSDRKRSADQIMRELKQSLSVTPGVQVFLSTPPAISIGGRATSSRYQLALQSSNLDELYRNAAILLDRMSTLPGITDPTSDLLVKSPYVKVDIDRQRADALGVTAGQVESVLYDTFGARQVSTIYGQANQYQVLMELLPEFQRDANALSMVYIRSKNGTLIPLGSVARLTPKVGPFTVNHAGQLPAVTLSFNLKPGVALGTAVDQVQQLARATLPSTITTSFAGTAQAFQESQQGLAFMLVVAILVIYLVLGVLYESFIHPITILSGLPFAAFGALITLVAFGIDLNIYAYVGIIMLVGLVKKNAIMMVDFALQAERTEGKPAAEAIVQACLVRFRPIMMTTMSALVGTLPIAIGFGAGGEARQPLGLAVVGGLAFSQMVTLYVTPVIYTYFDAFQKWMGSRSAEAQSILGPAGEATLGAAD